MFRNLLARNKPYYRMIFAMVASLFVAGIASGHADDANLTVKRVILSTGGVGYFELQAKVNGNAEVSFSVPLNQVDDVLKSLVIADSGGGSATVTTAGRRPLSQIFQDYPFRARDLVSPARLLNRLRGARVKIAGATVMEGRVLRVAKEVSQIGDGKKTIIRHRATLLTKEGLRQFVVEEVAGIDFLDLKLKQQLNEATRLLAEHGSKDRREIIIQTKGEGSRLLQLGYVVAVPLWKSTYRLVLPAKGDQARLQGWAVVENLSGQNWRNVELTVVSGNPVTFRQALYEPYFVKRPLVPLEITGRVLPPPDDGTVANKGRLRASEIRRRGKTERAKKSRARRSGMANDGAAGMLAAAPSAQGRREFDDRSPPRLVSAAKATASDSATQVAFTFKGGQNIASGFTAMLPIIDRLIPAARISLYQARVHRSRPLATVRLKNDGESGLPPGILTLFEADAKGRRDFIGDARIKSLPAGETRLLSFAVDQKSRVAATRKSDGEITKITADGGLLKISLQQESATRYLIKAPKLEGRRFIIEHDKRAGWNLKEPAKSDAVTLRAYRFELALDAGNSKTLAVVLQRTRRQSLAITRLSSRQLVLYSKNGKIGIEAKAALERIAQLRQTVDRTSRQINRLKQKRSAIAKEQNRIRANMRSIARTSKLFGRYVKKLNEQEDLVEALSERMEVAEKELIEAQNALSEFIRAVRF